MTGQNDRQDESLTGQALDQAGHCPLTDHYFEPWMMLSRPPEFILSFIPLTRMKCSHGKISSPLTKISVGKTKISGTEPVRPVT